MSSFPYRLSDKRAIAGSASIVVIGVVERQVGVEPREMGRRPWPQTQFEVRVLTSLKGDRRGAVRINSWFRFEGDRVIPDAGRWFEVGATYLIAAKYSQEFDFYSLMPGAGVVRLPDNTESSAPAAVETLITQWRDAIADPKPPRNPPTFPPVEEGEISG